MRTNIKARIACLFISKTTIMVNKREKIYFINNFYFRQTAILFLYFFSFILFLLLFPSLFLHHLRFNWAERAFFFADLFGRNFLVFFTSFWAEFFLQVGDARAPSAHPPPLSPILFTRLKRNGINTKRTKVNETKRYRSEQNKTEQKKYKKNKRNGI